jgi:hypothetical protein
MKMDLQSCSNFYLSNVSYSKIIIRWSQESLLEEGGVYNALDVASYTTRAALSSPVNVANDMLETLSKCNNVLVHAIATFFIVTGISLCACSQYTKVGPSKSKLANSRLDDADEFVTWMRLMTWILRLTCTCWVIIYYCYKFTASI